MYLKLIVCPYIDSFRFYLMSEFVLGKIFLVAVIFEMLRGQNVPIISARLLRVNISYPRFLGLLFFRFGNDKDGLVILDDNRKWWKWLTLLHRILCLIGLHLSDPIVFGGFGRLLHQVFNCARLLLLIVMNLWITWHQFFMNTQAILLANKMLKIFRRVRCLSNQKKIGFGGKKDLVLIILIMGFRVFEFISLIYSFFRTFDLRSIHSYWCFAFTVIYVNCIIHYNYLWYLALGVLHSEFNEFMQNEINHLPHPNFEVYLDTYRKIHETHILFKKMYSSQLLFYFLSNIMYICGFSNSMINNLSIGDPWLWITFLKIIFQNHLFCSVVERVFQEIDKTRSIIFELSIIMDTKESNQAVSIIKIKVPQSLENFNHFRWKCSLIISS